MTRQVPDHQGDAEDGDEDRRPGLPPTRSACSRSLTASGRAHRDRGDEDHLEEESGEDQDYYFSAATIDALEEEGADAELVALLRQALGDREGVELRWERAD